MKIHVYVQNVTVRLVLHCKKYTLMLEVLTLHDSCTNLTLLLYQTAKHLLCEQTMKCDKTVRTD